MIVSRAPLYGNIYTFDPIKIKRNLFSNFTFHINDNQTGLYTFKTGPAAVAKSRSPHLYLVIECAAAVQFLFLIAFDMNRKTWQQSPWQLRIGHISYLFYDPLRQHLIGLRFDGPFSMLIEEYDIKTLDFARRYTKQETNQYAYPQSHCSVFDYEENWIVEVRTRYEYPSNEAYYLKMDLNLVGKKNDIVVQFHRIPNIHLLCTMTYDIKTKTIFATTQYGSTQNDLFMLYMNTYTGNCTRQTLLQKTLDGWSLRDIQATFQEKARQILLTLYYQQSSTLESTCWIVLVQFDTMKVIYKKQADNKTFLNTWEFFSLQ